MSKPVKLTLWWKSFVLLQFLLHVVLFFGKLDVMSCEMQHFIVSSSDYPCHRESCLTLSHFAENVTNTNTSLIFAEGHHTLSVRVSVSNISKFSMSATNNSSVNIVCSNNAYFHFSTIGLVKLSNLTFIACYNNTIESVQQFVVNWSKFIGGQKGNFLNIIDTNAQIDLTKFSNGTGVHSSVLTWNRFWSFSGTIGGAIVAVRSNIAIDDSKFETNSASVGGATFFGTGSNITINNCEFIFNFATDCLEGFCLGGAMFASEGSKVIVINSIFENNTSDGDGGMTAISNATLSVSKSFISRNTANRGGAVAAFQYSILNFKISALKRNIANTSGGAIYLDGGSSKFSGCMISNNEAYEKGGVLFILIEGIVEVCNESIISNNTAVNGGVIHATSKLYISVYEFNTITHPVVNKVMNATKVVISISNSTFNNNKANLYGGVLSLQGYHSNSTIRNSTFCYNNANDRGGVISMSGSGNSAVIASSNFSYNTATIYGGVISLMYGSSLCITNSFFENNFSGIVGGVLDCYTLGHITVHKSYFSNNAADIGGGVLNIKNGSTFLVENSEFFNNTDTDLGAVIYAVGGNNITIDTCYFKQNSANYGGVLTAKLNVNIIISNSILHHNRASNNGGTIFTRRMCVTTISNSSFISNTAVSDGVTLASDGCTLHIEKSNFSYNTAGHDGGVAYAYDNSTIFIIGCHLNSNKAENSGGVIYGLMNSVIRLNNNIIKNNSAQNSGGGVHTQKNSSVTVEASCFTRNRADYGAAVQVYVQSMAIIKKCNFSENRAVIAGGSIGAYESSTISVQASNFALNMANVGGTFIAYYQSTLAFNESTFRNNTANHGGVAYIHSSNVTIKYSIFDQNSARYKGGVIYLTINGSVSIYSSNFTGNIVDNDGGVMILIGNSVVISYHSVFINNWAKDNGGIMHLYQSKAITFNNVYISSSAGINGGALVALNSSINIRRSCFMDNTATNTGGAIHAYSGSKLIVRDGYFIQNRAHDSGGSLYIAVNSSGYVFNSTFQQNTARNGGAISVLSLSRIIIAESSLFDNVAVTGGALAAQQDSWILFDDNDGYANSSNNICNNTATKAGGVFLESSNLYFARMSININFNGADESGGGIYAANSSIIFLNANIDFHGNQAHQYGGGIYLANSNLCDSKEMYKALITFINFTMNQADQGGAIYVQDEIAGSVCSNTPYGGNHPQGSGCFFKNVTSLYINFFNNSAMSSGDNLFGGLLDRCTVISNKHALEPNGITRFKTISRLTSYDTISSRPVRLCFCNETLAVNCDKQAAVIEVKMNDSFSLHVVAVDQVNKTVAATVFSSFTDHLLQESETIRRIGKACSKLKYQVPFPKSYETYKLIIFPEGPCCNKGISALNISISVMNCSCPPGFMRAQSETKCACICDRRYESFSKHITNCSIADQFVIRKGSFWISYIGNSGEDNTSPYFIYPYCPLDYCQPPSKLIGINLSLPNGSDSQCANNRMGILCGKCLPNYSLSLGSSKCIECPDDWYGLLIGILLAAFLAGIILVFALLFLNLTVAIGTLNSIIFYANIIFSNRSIYFNQTSLVFISAFISWLNLNIGFDVCIIKGLNSYTKTWLELAFPIYIIILVIIIIYASSRSTVFSNLLGKKNPVATLATLILLSYTKLLDTVIISFSFINLKYPNGTVVTKWFPDASMQFKEWKNIVLICIGIFILVLGLLYTILIFCWQWLLHCPRLMFLKWTRNQKLHSFIDTYHTPHTAKHRYWTGLLLLIRVAVYLVSTFTMPVDPRISLFTVVITSCCLLAYKTSFNIYKNKLLNAMDSFVYLNISIFAIITWYTLDDPSSRHKETIQRVCAYISVGTILVLLLLVSFYHIFRYASVKLYTVSQSSDFGKRIKHHLEYYVHDQNSSNTDRYNLLDLMDDTRETDGYSAPPLYLHRRPTVTTSTVSMSDSVISETP